MRKIFEFYFKLYGFFQLKLPTAMLPKTALDLPSGFLFKILTLEDLSYFDFVKEKEEYHQICKNRLTDTSNFTCFAIVDTEKRMLAYYSWINQSDSYWVKEINAHIDFKRTNSCLFEDDQTLEGYRRKGFHTFVMQQRISFCQQHAIEAIRIVVHLKNKPALKTIKKYGFKRINWLPLYYRQGTLKYTLRKLKLIK